MDPTSFLFLCAASIPTLLVARIWWLARRCDDELAAYLQASGNRPASRNGVPNPSDFSGSSA